MDSGVDETTINAAESPAISRPEVSAGLVFLFALAVGVLVMCLSASQALVGAVAGGSWSLQAFGIGLSPALSLALLVATALLLDGGGAAPPRGAALRNAASPVAREHLPAGRR